MNATNTICQICDGISNHSFGGVHLHFGRKKNGWVAVFESKLPFHRRDRSLILPGAQVEDNYKYLIEFSQPVSNFLKMLELID